MLFDGRVWKCLQKKDNCVACKQVDVRRIVQREKKDLSQMCR